MYNAVIVGLNISWYIRATLLTSFNFLWNKTGIVLFKRRLFTLRATTFAFYDFE